MKFVFEAVGLALWTAGTFSTREHTAQKRQRDCKKVFVGSHPAETRLRFGT